MPPKAKKGGGGGGGKGEDSGKGGGKEVIKGECEKLWKRLQAATDCNSLLKKNLTPEIYKKLKPLQTSFGGGLQDCMRSGVENLDSHVGIYACDPDAYETFAPVFDGVIKDYHNVASISQPAPFWGEEKIKFKNLDPQGKFILSTRVRVARSIEGFAFPPMLNKADRLKIEEDSKNALEKLDPELQGVYVSLGDMKPEEQKRLTDDHFLFNRTDRFLKMANGYDDWPTGRGIFHTPDKKFLVWVNEEDHLRFISMQKGGDLRDVYLRLCKAMRQMERKLTFARSPRLGFLTFCPSNLGTTLRASVHIKIPKLAASADFQQFLEKNNIQARGIDGEHTESPDGIYDISNKRRLGLTEFEAIQEMRKGVEAVIAREKKLGGGK